MSHFIAGYLARQAGRAAPQVLVVYILPWLVLLGGGTMLTIGLLNVRAAHASGSWPQTVGVVMSAVPEVSDHPELYVLSRSGTTIYGTRLNYIYRVAGREHTGNRVRFGEISTNTPDRALRILQEYPPGKRVKVHYNPKSPAKAVLEPGTEAQTYILPVIGGLLTLLGLATVIGLPIAARAMAR